MQVEVTLEETAVLIRWKKRSDNHVLVRMKAEAILYASRGVDVGIIAELMAEWQPTRMCSVLAGHAGNQNSRPSSLSRPTKRASTPSSGTSRRCVRS